MSFQIMYYFTIACPTVEKTIQMIDRYAERGVNRIQLDLPSADPFGESDFVKDMMHNALKDHPDYGYYMDAIREIRRRHPEMVISMVVYGDVINAIGVENYVSFLKEIHAEYNMIAGEHLQCRHRMDEEGIGLVRGAIAYHQAEYDIEDAREYGENEIVLMRTKRVTESLNRKCHAWADRVRMAREGGVKCQIWAVAEIASGEDMAERKNAGMQGAIVGNVLMRLWNNEDALWSLLDEFQSYAE